VIKILTCDIFDLVIVTSGVFNQCRNNYTVEPSQVNGDDDDDTICVLTICWLNSKQKSLVVVLLMYRLVVLCMRMISC